MRCMSMKSMAANLGIAVPAHAEQNPALAWGTTHRQIYVTPFPHTQHSQQTCTRTPLATAALTARARCLPDLAASNALTSAICLATAFSDEPCGERSCLSAAMAAASSGGCLGAAAAVADLVECLPVDGSGAAEVEDDWLVDSLLTAEAVVRGCLEPAAMAAEPARSAVESTLSAMRICVLFRFDIGSHRYVSSRRSALRSCWSCSVLRLFSLKMQIKFDRPWDRRSAETGDMPPRRIADASGAAGRF
jgi:hypothetical protein